MTYNHSRKAGNRGDVWKHFFLTELAALIEAGTDTFRYAESHCGSPCHQLESRGEWRRGVGQVIDKPSCDCSYLSIAREWVKTGLYPAGWVFTASQLVERFSKVEVHLFDNSTEVASAYPPAVDGRLQASATVHFKANDGYASIQNLSDLDLVFLDPPYYPNAESDWRAVSNACKSLASRGINFVAWYPFYWPSKPQQLSDSTRCPAWEVQWSSCGSKPSQNLKGCGMLISNGLAPKIEHLHADTLRMADCIGSELIIRQPVE